MQYGTRCYYNVRSKADQSQFNLDTARNQQLKSGKQKNEQVKTDMLGSISEQSGDCMIRTGIAWAYVW